MSGPFVTAELKSTFVQNLLYLAKKSLDLFAPQIEHELAKQITELTESLGRKFPLCNVLRNRLNKGFVSIL